MTSSFAARNRAAFQGDGKYGNNCAMWGLLVTAAATIAALPALAASPYGVWQNEEGTAEVRVEACGESLCGKVVGLREPLDKEGKPKLDWMNPDAKLRDRPVMGLMVLHSFVPDGPDRWVNGTIYDPDSGNTYKSTMTVLPNGTAEVRGYVLLPVIGRTTYWKPIR
jgi:uncharacterized protein (DUF2147 family)